MKEKRELSVVQEKKKRWKTINALTLKEKVLMRVKDVEWLSLLWDGWWLDLDVATQMVVSSCLDAIDCGSNNRSHN
ncbi:hypothetical protein VNO77_19460 [Canavalia gladiata]|uniref:Uncharacterized protein n=1 Tax=Canavalia gladiata TaxID=3824 RepID=A0AAN9LSM1_CANGL